MHFNLFFVVLCALAVVLVPSVSPINIDLTENSPYSNILGRYCLYVCIVRVRNCWMVVNDIPANRPSAREPKMNRKVARGMEGISVEWGYEELAERRVATGTTKRSNEMR
ncbi:hypothetical protein C8R44DRAFT_744474 [Mycena epipterygia]|nr:hypothetical protein C8R44DRAFT_744474 [Mycena epipterygia]